MHLTAANCYAAAGLAYVGELCRPMHVYVRVYVRCSMPLKSTFHHARLIHQMTTLQHSVHHQAYHISA